MAQPAPPKLEITVSRSDKTLTLVEVVGSTFETLLTASIVSGCDDTGTPAGSYMAGKWIKDKTNPIHGPTPWSKDSWGNPYGPYFLPLNDPKTKKYTTYGIHGTRGPLVGNFEKPPLPQGLMSLFLDDDKAKFLYCSHGCVRISNQNITKMFEVTTKDKYVGSTISVTIK